jgi:hypothetical protein
MLGQVLTVSGNPAVLSITTAVAGSQPVAVSDNSTTYTVTAVFSSHITAQLASNTPVGVTLTINMAAPTGATSAGPVALDVTARNVVNNITGVFLQTRGITYQLSALASAGVITSRTATVTLTIVAGP